MATETNGIPDAWIRAALDEAERRGLRMQATDGTEMAAMDEDDVRAIVAAALPHLMALWEASEWWGIYACPRCRTRVVNWRGEEPPVCGMHFPELVEAEYIEVVPRAALDRVSAEDTRDALRYLIERVDREFKDQDQPPELDFVLMAANEVRHLAEFSGGASAGGRTDPARERPPGG